jgi:hypothetical protein
MGVVVGEIPTQAKTGLEWGTRLSLAQIELFAFSF